MKHIYFITNYSNKIGFGHLKRCLNIAEYLSRFKNIYFINLIKQNIKFKLPYLKKNFNFIYNKKNCNKILIIDLVKKEFYKKKVQNLLNHSKKDISIIIDNEFDLKFKSNYRIFPYISSLSKNKIKYSGEKYFFFSKKILNISKNKKLIKKNQVVISMGGSDPSRLTIKTIKKINKKIMNNYRVVIIIGPLFKKKYIKEIIKFSKNLLNFKIYYDPSNFYEILKQSKIAIINNGNTKYECALLGVPFILLSNKNKDIDKCIIFSKKFKILNKKNNFDLKKIDIVKLIRNFLINKKLLNYTANKNKNIFSIDTNKSIKVIKKIVKNEIRKYK